MRVVSRIGIEGKSSHGDTSSGGRSGISLNLEGFLTSFFGYRTQSKRKSPQWVTKNPDRGVDLLKANARCTTSALQVRLKVHVEVQLL